VHSGGGERGTGSVHCEVYQRDRPDSVLRQSPAVLPICFEYGFPRFLWVGEEGYSEESLALLHYGGPAVQDLFFSPLAARGAPWLAIELVGTVFPSDFISTTVGIVEPPVLHFPEVPDGGFELVRPAIINYFRSEFESQQVVIYAHDTTFLVKRKAADWASDHQLPYFDNEPEMMDWLAGITPEAGEHRDQ
jgi:hypothetical protein